MNQKKLFYGGFIGTLAIVVIILGVFYFKGENRMAELGKVYSSWVDATGTISGFHARFPKEPEYATQDLPIEDSGEVIKQELFVGGSEQMSFFISSSRYPSDVDSSEENMRQALAGMVDAIPDGEIISSRYTVPFSGANYLEYKIHRTENNISYKGRIFLSSRALYQIYASYQELAYNDDEYTYFVNSFRIK